MGKAREMRDAPLLWSLVTLALVSTVVPGGAAAKSAYESECASVCANPDPAVDQALLPDPRSLATAEHGYTSTWQDCHSSPDVPRRPKTCREWCASRDRGKELIEAHGLIGSFLTAATYANLWKAWGLAARPPEAEFERHVVDRYGFQPMPPGVSNPYPLPGEDPAVANGGSGQLPMGLIQTRGAGGKYDGGIGFTCLLCHAGRIGDESDGPGLGSRFGIGNTTFDLDVFSMDLGKAGGTPIPLPYPNTDARGTVNAVSDFEFLMAVRDFDTLDNTPFVKAFAAHAAPGDQDPPAWHNTGSRPRVYMDGGVSADNTRALMQFLTASIDASASTSAETPGSGAWIKKQEADFEDVRTFVESIAPPAFPGAIDGPRARAGERIFHEKRLFGTSPPFGNGSCSSCHGVYSRNYADRLPDPRMIGVAAQIVPRNVAQTDPARVDALSPELRWGWGTLWFAYADNSAKDANPYRRQFNETMNDYVLAETNGLFYTRNQGACGWVGVDGYGRTAAALIGYAAPPLHGIWSTAPYLHNGSVPTVYDLLRYGERPTYWRRPLRTPGSPPDRGFDVSLAAYDFAKLGWKYDRLDCSGVPMAQCDPEMPLVPGAAESVLNLPGSELWLAHQSTRPLTQAEIEMRKIYDTTRYGRSNAGHWWTSRATLSDEEVADLIAYLKTL